MSMRIALSLIFACSIQFGWTDATQAAINFDQLLQQTRNMRADEAKQSAQRLTNFKNDLASQERKVNEASAKRSAAEANSNALSKLFDANEAHIKELKMLLDQHQGNLGELFGVTRQIAGDAANVLQESLISVQFPADEGEEDRVAFLRREAGAKELPSILELERIWFELQREMTESGKVVRLTTDILQMDDSSKKANVVRIGSFTAVGGEDYFAYLPSRQTLAVLSGNVDGRLQNIAEELTNTTSGDKYMPAVVDPASGALLSMYVQRPNILQRIQAGQLVGYIIIAVGVIGALAAIFQYIYLFIMQYKVARQLKDLKHPNANNPLGRLLLAIKYNSATTDDSTEVIDLRISEAVLREVPKIERFSRSVAGFDRYCYRHDYHLPDHHRFRCQRSKVDGEWYWTGDDCDRAWSRYRHTLIVCKRRSHIRVTPTGTNFG
ncbi:MAG: MotA ExbB protein [Gammaproteobacteria bacterium]|nr:MotA ExbB protein [Gammaproteobacteria bacterium]